MIEYRPSFRFSSNLRFFPEELRAKLDKQHSKWKRKRQSGNERNSGGKRQPGNDRNSGDLQKAREEIRDLAELVSLTNANADTTNQRNITTLNANPMGGRNQRQQKREDTNNNSNNTVDTVQAIIEALEVRFNISTVTISVKLASSTNDHQRYNYPPETTALNESDTNAETEVAGRNMIVDRTQLHRQKRRCVRLPKVSGTHKRCTNCFCRNNVRLC